MDCQEASISGNHCCSAVAGAGRGCSPEPAFAGEYHSDSPKIHTLEGYIADDAELTMFRVNREVQCLGHRLTCL